MTNTTKPIEAYCPHCDSDDIYAFEHSVVDMFEVLSWGDDLCPDGYGNCEEYVLPAYICNTCQDYFDRPIFIIDGEKEK